MALSRLPSRSRKRSSRRSAPCGAALLGLGYLMWQTGGNFVESGETTAQLAIPKAPFIYGMSVLCTITGLVHLAFMVRPSRAMEEGEGGTL